MCSATQTSDLWTTAENTKTSFQTNLFETYWKLKEQNVQKEFERVFPSKVNACNTAAASTEESWNLLQKCLYLTPLMRPVVKQRFIITKDWRGGEMIKWIWLLLKKDGVVKRGSRDATKNNTYRSNEMRNVQFAQQRRLLKWSSQT